MMDSLPLSTTSAASEVETRLPRAAEVARAKRMLRGWSALGGRWVGWFEGVLNVAVGRRGRSEALRPDPVVSTQAQPKFKPTRRETTGSLPSND